MPTETKLSHFFDNALFEIVGMPESVGIKELNSFLQFEQLRTRTAYRLELSDNQRGSLDVHGYSCDTTQHISLRLLPQKKANASSKTRQSHFDYFRLDDVVWLS
jgi:endoglucanase Acf2